MIRLTYKMDGGFNRTGYYNDSKDVVDVLIGAWFESDIDKAYYIMSYMEFGDKFKTKNYSIEIIDDKEFQEKLAMRLAKYEIEQFHYGLVDAIHDEEIFGERLRAEK